MRPRRPDLPAPVALLILLLFLPACLAAPPPRVGVKPLSAELVFGIPPLDEPVGPPNLDSDLEPVLRTKSGLDGLRPIRGTGLPVCGETDTYEVEVPATEMPATNPPETGKPREPKEGTYRWKLDGSKALRGTEDRIPLPFFDQRSVRNVARLPDDTQRNTKEQDFSFTIVERDVLNTSLYRAMTYEVITSRIVRPTEETVVDPGQQGVPPVQQGKYQNGIYLTRVHKKGIKSGALVDAVFEPDPPLTILPLPATFSQTFTVTSVDPDTFETWTLTGFVKEKLVVDACGENVDSYFIDGELEVIAGDDQVRRDYDYGVATQFGGLIVFEHVVQPCVKPDPREEKDPTQAAGEKKCRPPPKLDLEMNAGIGQIQPGPLPRTAPI